MLSSPRSLGFVLAAILGAMLVPGCRPDDPTGPSQIPQFSQAPVPHLASERAIPDQYIVVFKSSLPDPAAEARALVAQHGGTLRFTYTSAIKGFAASLPLSALDALRRNPNVAYLEADRSIQLFDNEVAPPWGIDRVDQRTLPLDASYTWGTSGSGVHVYIIDTGIRSTHRDFEGRVVSSFNSAKGKGTTEDCNGHGTHVAGTVGGSVYGVAKAVTLYAVRVLDCYGSGTTSGVIAGIDWVTSNHLSPAVANMSLGGSYDQALNDAVEGSINSGVVYAIAAGNSATDACTFSPASAPRAMTIGASTKLDEQASYSNFGNCVDLYAPGSAIKSDWNTSDTASYTLSGTSMASPHAAGAAALYLESHPLDSPAAVSAALTGAATQGLMTKVGLNSPNLLLFTGDPATAQPSSGSSSGTTKSGPCKQRWQKGCQ